ncbi:MAG TPA: DUF4349 domain-containing protein [Anaerolineae bacterium]|nr:DUF4349 domain-containing protein [Anaerolineae bacterium]
MIPKTTKSFILLTILFLLAACAAPEAEVVEVEVTRVVTETEIVEVAGEAVEVEVTRIVNSYNTDSRLDDSAKPQQTQQQLIIRTGNLNLQVTDPTATLGQIEQLVNNSGGWIVTSQLRSNNNNAANGSVVARVPAQDFHDMMTQFKGLADKVVSETTSGQDVTEDYVDANARLQNLEATAERVRNFLDEADNVEEALRVSNELSALESQIEVLKGRIQYLSQSAAFSTINVELTPYILRQPVIPAGWQPSENARQAFDSLISTLQYLIDILIFAVIYWFPILLIAAIPLYGLNRLIRWGRKKRLPPTPTPQTD